VGASVALELHVLWHELLRPHVLREVVLQDELRVVGVSEEVALGDGPHIVVEEFVSVFV